MKIILIVGDGMSDRPTQLLNGKTPLQVAKKPSMDKVAKLGVCGLMDPISPGIPPGSDTSHLAILSYDPYQTYTGRGGFEALGAGINVQHGDVSLRGNFATKNNKHIVLDRRAGRISEGFDDLAETLNQIKLESFPELEIIFKHTVEHRCALMLRGPHLSWMVSDSDPHKEKYKIQEVRPLDKTQEAVRTATILKQLKEKFNEILKNHATNIKRKKKGLLPANTVLLRGAGILPRVIPITEKYGIKGLVVAAGALYKGVCKAVGFDAIDIPEGTGTVETNTVAKAKAVVKNLWKYDYFFVHIKGTDNASHDGNAEQKVMMIEKIDALVEYLINNIDLKDVIMGITADHTTSLDFREHVGDPVPVVIMGPGVRVDSVKKYSEIDCANGGLGRIRGVNLTPILIDLIGKSKKFGV